MTKVNVIAEEKDEEQLADVLFLLVAIKGFVALEFISYIRQLLVDSLYFRLFAFACQGVMALECAQFAE